MRTWFDDDLDRFEIDVRIVNPLAGLVLAYDGWFDLDIRPVDEIPGDIRPREERPED